jgi:protein-disulfide isomerase
LRPAPLRAEDAPAAVVAGDTVTFSAVDQAAADRLRRLRDEEFGIKRQALEEILVQRLTAREAAARNMTPDALLAAEVDAKAPPVSDAEKKDLYEKNKARMDGKSYEEMGPLLDNYLLQQKMLLRKSEYIRSLKAKYGVMVMMEPSRVSVEPSGPSKGAKDAPVVLVAFSDFQCPYCSNAEETLAQVEKVYGKRLRIVFRHYPLSMHKDAPRAAEAAICAEDQGKFWPYHDLLFANQDKLSEDGLKELAAKAGLKKDAFAKCLASGRHAADWKKDADDGRKAGVTGTPSFFINGRMLFGNQTFDAFVQAIDDEFMRLGKPLPGAQGKK